MGGGGRGGGNVGVSNSPSNKVCGYNTSQKKGSIPTHSPLNPNLNKSPFYRMNLLRSKSS